MSTTANDVFEAVQPDLIPLQIRRIAQRLHDLHVRAEGDEDAIVAQIGLVALYLHEGCTCPIEWDTTGEHPRWGSRCKHVLAMEQIEELGFSLEWVRALLEKHFPKEYLERPAPETFARKLTARGRVKLMRDRQLAGVGLWDKADIHEVAVGSTAGNVRRHGRESFQREVIRVECSDCDDADDSPAL